MGTMCDLTLLSLPPPIPSSPLVIHKSVYRTMMAILAGARLLATLICPMRDSVRKETTDGRIHCERAGVLEWYYGSCLVCSYSLPINRAVYSTSTKCDKKNFIAAVTNKTDKKRRIH